jgi:hypothetical protein
LVISSLKTWQPSGSVTRSAPSLDAVRRGVAVVSVPWTSGISCFWRAQ